MVHFSMTKIVNVSMNFISSLLGQGRGGRSKARMGGGGNGPGKQQVFIVTGASSIVFFCCCFQALGGSRIVHPNPYTIRVVLAASNSNRSTVEGTYGHPGKFQK